MQPQFRDLFLQLWDRYFPGAELPLTFYYTDKKTIPENHSTTGAHRCVIALLNRVRQGHSLRLGKDSIGCSGGKRYLGYSSELRADFKYFLSCGLPGKVEGERYKQTPELVEQLVHRSAPFQAPHPYIVFKRWDKLTEVDGPEVVIFFSPPDVLAGLYTLAGFDNLDENAVIAPFGAGCASVVRHPYKEINMRRPRCILGLFDPSARPYVPANSLTFATPMKKFHHMVTNMEESFLITSTWQKISRRMAKL